MDMDDRQVLETARQGDTTAAAELVTRYYERLYGFLRRLAGNEADGADLTQRAFGRIWRSLPTYAGHGSVSSWVHGIAYRTFVDWLRSRPNLAESRPDEWWMNRPGTTPTPAEEASAADLASVLYAEVDRLDPELRTTVHLHYYQALTLQETADALDVATSTVKYRLRQAVAELQTRLSDVRPLASQPLLRPSV